MQKWAQDYTHRINCITSENMWTIQYTNLPSQQQVHYEYSFGPQCLHGKVKYTSKVCTPVTRVSCQGSGKLLIKVFCASYNGNQDIYQEEKMYTCKDYFMPAKKKLWIFC